MSDLRVNRIPEELRAAPQWVLWRYEERDGKRTKPPFQANGRHASHSDAGTWTTFDRAFTSYHAGKWDGIGYVLADEDPYAGVDLDHCIDPETGEVLPWAQEIVARLESYAEISPSGTGVRIFLRGKLPAGAPKGGRKRTGFGPDGTGAVELYCRLRYLTVTGRHLTDTPEEIADRGDAFEALYAELFPDTPKEAVPAPATAPTPLALDDSELLSRMFGSRSGPEILRLWNGDTSGHHGDDSAADLALCNYLAWWCAGARDRVDRLFRQSRLYRDKWDETRGETTYGGMTVDLALADLHGGYEGPSQAFEVEDPEPPLPPETRSQLDEARMLVPALAEVLKGDAGWPYTDDGRRTLGLLRALDKAAWARARAAIQRTRGLSIRDVEAQLPKPSEFLPKPETPATATGSNRAGDTLSDCPAPALVVPLPYYVDNGVTGRWLPDQGGELRKVPFAFAPILITGRTLDITGGGESLLLTWRWARAGWQTRILERSRVLEKRKLLELAGYGFPVGDDNSKELVGYLHRLEAANRPELPCARVSSHLGWQGEPGKAPFLCGRSLILPDGEVETVDALDVDHPEEWSEHRICFHGSGEGQDQIVDAFHRAGEFDQWRRAVRVLKDFPKALIVFYAGLAAPLLPLFGVSNFIIDVAHDTTIGKTTALRAAASLWGNPDERSACSVVLTWDASRVGLERTSEVLGCLPLFVDDTKQAKHPRMVADLIYAVTSGRGRVRGTIRGLAHTPVWRTVMISTGEQPATSFTQDGGTRTRVLSLGGMPFGGQSAELGRLTTTLNAQVCQHYGHAGPRFLAWLQLNRATWPEWKVRHAEFVTAFAESAPSPEAGRLAPYAALITIAGEMAHRALGLPWEFTDPVQCLWHDLAAEAGDAAGSVRALDDVLSWAQSHERMFLGRFFRDGFVERTPPAVYGRWDDGDDWEYLSIYPTVLDAALSQLGYSPAAIKRGWKERGWLRCRDGKLTFDVPTGNGTETRKMVSIRRSAFEGVSDA